MFWPSVDGKKLVSYLDLRRLHMRRRSSTWRRWAISRKMWWLSIPADIPMRLLPSWGCHVGHRRGTHWSGWGRVHCPGRGILGAWIERRWGTHVWWRVHLIGRGHAHRGWRNTRWWWTWRWWVTIGVWKALFAPLLGIWAWWRRVSWGRGEAWSLGLLPCLCSSRSKVLLCIRVGLRGRVWFWRVVRCRLLGKGMGRVLPLDMALGSFQVFGGATARRLGGLWAASLTSKTSSFLTLAFKDRCRLIHITVGPWHYCL